MLLSKCTPNAHRVQHRETNTRDAPYLRHLQTQLNSTSVAIGPDCLRSLPGTQTGSGESVMCRRYIWTYWIMCTILTVLSCREIWFPLLRLNFWLVGCDFDLLLSALSLSFCGHICICCKHNIRKQPPKKGVGYRENSSYAKCTIGSFWALIRSIGFVKHQSSKERPQCPGLGRSWHFGSDI